MIVSGSQKELGRRLGDMRIGGNGYRALLEHLLEASLHAVQDIGRGRYTPNRASRSVVSISKLGGAGMRDSTYHSNFAGTFYGVSMGCAVWQRLWQSTRYGSFGKPYLSSSDYNVWTD